MNAKAGLLKRYGDKIVGVLGCYERVVLNGTFTAIAHLEAFAAVLRQQGIRCFDLRDYVEPVREQIRQCAEHLAARRGPGEAPCPVWRRFSRPWRRARRIALA